MAAVPRHQYWRTSGGEAVLLQYVPKCVAQFSDPSYDEWMDDDASADSVARSVCFECHPWEPEMALQLPGAQFMQYELSAVSGGCKTITAPWPGMDIVPDSVSKYETCPWRGEYTSLLEWLCDTNEDGAMVGRLRVKHTETVIDTAWAAYQSNGTTDEAVSDTAFHMELRRAYKA